MLQSPFDPSSPLITWGEVGRNWATSLVRWGLLLCALINLDEVHTHNSPLVADNVYFQEVVYVELIIH